MSLMSALVRSPSLEYRAASACDFVTMSSLALIGASSALLDMTADLTHDKVHIFFV